MEKDLGGLLLWGIFFIAIGLWMRRKDGKRLELIEKNLLKKEEDLYELYEALEEIMEELISIGMAGNKRKEERVSSKYHEKDDIDHGSWIKVDEKPLADPSPNKERASLANQEDIQDKTSNKHSEVVRLKEEGHSIEEIAKELGIGVGEVRLILKFYNR